jgi:hypothetical protein
MQRRTAQNIWPGKWRCGVEGLQRTRTAMEQWHECAMSYRGFFTWPTTLHSPSQCTGRDANQRRMEGRDETFVQEAIQIGVSWISKWQRKLSPGLSWCDISCLRRFSVTKLNFIFAFGPHISRGLLSAEEDPPSVHEFHALSQQEVYKQFFFLLGRQSRSNPSGQAQKWLWLQLTVDMRRDFTLFHPGGTSLDYHRASATKCWIGKVGTSLGHLSHST